MDFSSLGVDWVRASRRVVEASSGNHPATYLIAQGQFKKSTLPKELQAVSLVGFKRNLVNCLVSRFKNIIVSSIRRRRRLSSGTVEATTFDNILA